MRILKSALAVAAVAAGCIIGSTAANAQWWGPGYGGWGGYPYGGYPYGGPGVSIGIGGRGAGFYITSGIPYYGGYRGYPYFMPGYQLYNGYYFPPAAFGVRVAPRAYGGSAHVQWCYQTYRSYRASDNTFQPNYGPRQQCVSPYR